MPATYELRLDFADACYIVVRYAALSIADAIADAYAEHPDATSSTLLAIVSHERQAALAFA